MRVDLGRFVLFACLVLLLPFTASAQEATIIGTVTDTTGGVLPGVTVVVVHEASGNQFEAVTDRAACLASPSASARIGSPPSCRASRAWSARAYNCWSARPCH